jgi:glyoxylase-like metal-dependent hydrolase (beta-lactamase superfamily II)
VTSWTCKACGTQFAPSATPPARCPICEDERQYIPQSGQEWVDWDELVAEQRADVHDDAGILGVGSSPGFAIGQRALLVKGDAGNVLWDCISVFDDELGDLVAAEGGLDGIAISHPHYYGAMVEWAAAFGCPIHLHAAERKWVMRPDPAIEFWDGETLELGGGVTLIRCGGHYEGGQVLYWPERRALLSGDIVQVIPDRRFVGFMYSYPNLIPLPASRVEAIGAALEPYPFDTIHGAWWGRNVPADGSEVVRRSVARYVRAITGPGLTS